MLPGAGGVAEEEGEESGQSAVESGLVLGLKAAVLQRLPIGGTADTHDPTHRIGNDLLPLVVTVRAALAEGGDGGHHEAGILALERGVIEPQRRQVSGRESLHDDVGEADQLLEDVGALRRLQVERDAPLVQIRQQEEQALLRMGVILEKRGHAPAALATRRLHLDDVGSEVAQEFGTEGSGNPLTDVQHTNIVQCRGDHRHGSSLSDVWHAIGPQTT
ncbi:MAG: hypothetical protein A2Z31_02355 [candidate division NC10 bacterium RBG_16_65_8]|nr:MAG: hypothetical protein A2Z31_02355 [candidate division NC10 bacterium RBG_16_65_8]